MLWVRIMHRRSDACARAIVYAALITGDVFANVLRAGKPMMVVVNETLADNHQFELVRTKFEYVERFLFYLFSFILFLYLNPNFVLFHFFLPPPFVCNVLNVKRPNSSLQMGTCATLLAARCYQGSKGWMSLISYRTLKENQSCLRPTSTLQWASSNASW